MPVIRIFSFIAVVTATMLTPTLVPLQAVEVTAANPPRPDINYVEVHQDSQTLTITWEPVADVHGYEFFWRRDDNSAWNKFAWAHERNLNGIPAFELKPAYTWQPTLAQSYQITMRSKIYGPDQVSAFAIPAQVKMDGAVSGVTATVSTSPAAMPKIDLKWKPYPSRPFASYNFFVAPSATALTRCYAGYDSDVTTQSLSFDKGCDRSALTPGSQQWVGLRVIQRQDKTGNQPNVWTQMVQRKVIIPDPGPADNELLKVSSVGGRWEIVDKNGAIVRLNGISIRRYRADASPPNWAINKPYATRAQLQEIMNKGFNTIRVNMSWHYLEPQPGQWDEQSFRQLDQVVADASSLGLYVILDPIHHVNNQYLPQWAWDRETLGQKVDHRVTTLIKNQSGPYLRRIIKRYGSNPNVVAIDLANEVRMPNLSGQADRAAHLSSFYNALTATVRAIDPDQMVIVQPYYGNYYVTPTDLSGFRYRGNVVWSFHDYYMGDEGTAQDDGFRDGGGAYFIGYRSTGCYPAGFSKSACLPGGNLREAVRRPSMRNMVKVHDDAAQANAMAIMIGEYGLGHQTLDGAYGWGGGYKFLQDKNQVYDSFGQKGASRIYWAWNMKHDATFGLYNPDTPANPWHYWTDALFE